MLLEVNACKADHKVTRWRIEPSLETFADPTQRGGIQSRSTDFALHIVRLFFIWAQIPGNIHGGVKHNSGISAACIFCNVSDAFYKMASQLVAQTPIAAGIRDVITHKLGLSQDEQAAFADLL